MIASAAGGVDIEQVAHARIVRVDVDPLIGFADFQVQQLRRALGFEQRVGAPVRNAGRRRRRDLDRGGRGAGRDQPADRDRRRPARSPATPRSLLDDDAVSRHPARSGPVAWSSDSEFMQRCRELGVIGVDNRPRVPAPRRPSVSILGNGAGLTMATYDQVDALGRHVAGAIELHGALARGVEHTAEVFEAFFLLEADVLFINAFYQLRSTDALAQRAGAGARPAGRARAQPGRLPDARRQPAGLASDPRAGRLLLQPVLRAATDRCSPCATRSAKARSGTVTILVDCESKILVQGITGRPGGFSPSAWAGGTPIVGGVTPGKGGSEVAGVPVFDSMREAVAATGANAVLSCIAPAYVSTACSRWSTPASPLAVLYIENIPVHDAIRCAPTPRPEAPPPRSEFRRRGEPRPRQHGRPERRQHAARADRHRLQERHPHLRDHRGAAPAGLGESTVVCLGGDRVVGTRYDDVLRLFEADPDTDLVVVIGEPGGGLEYPAAALAATMRTPVVAYITGQGSPQDARMGHAGAVVGDDERSRPQSKMEAFSSAGLPSPAAGDGHRRNRCTGS